MGLHGLVGRGLADFECASDPCNVGSVRDERYVIVRLAIGWRGMRDIGAGLAGALILFFARFITPATVISS